MEKTEEERQEDSSLERQAINRTRTFLSGVEDEVRDLLDRHDLEYFLLDRKRLQYTKDGETQAQTFLLSDRHNSDAVVSSLYAIQVDGRSLGARMRNLVCDTNNIRAIRITSSKVRLLTNEDEEETFSLNFD